MRRSVAVQVEYWATLGRIVEHSGLTAQEAQAVIEGYEAAASEESKKAAGLLEALKMRVLTASTNGVLQANPCAIVEKNRQQAVVGGVVRKGADNFADGSVVAVSGGDAGCEVICLPVAVRGMPGMRALRPPQTARANTQ